MKEKVKRNARIVELYQQGVRVRQIARIYKVNHAVISRILKRKKLSPFTSGDNMVV